MAHPLIIATHPHHSCYQPFAVIYNQFCSGNVIVDLEIILARPEGVPARPEGIPARRGGITLRTDSKKRGHICYYGFNQPYLMASHL